VKCVAFSPDGRTLASGGRDKLVKVWKTETGEVMQVYAGHRYVWNQSVAAANIGS
jgi:WD40 repeat protein